MNIGHLRGIDHLIFSGRQITVTDVIKNRSGEQPGILKYHTEHGPQIFPVHIADIHTIDENPSAVYIIEPKQQIDQRSLSRPRRAYDGHHLATFNRNIEVPDDRCVPIGEADVFEGNLALCRPRKKACGSRFCFLRFIQDFENTLKACKCSLYLGGQLGYLGQRIIDLPDISDERLQITY